MLLFLLQHKPFDTVKRLRIFPSVSQTKSPTYVRLRLIGSASSLDPRPASPKLRPMRTLILTALLLPPLAASADESFRCGNSIASSDMTVEELLKKCGEPTTRKTEIQDVMVRNRDHGIMTKQGTTKIETWTYDRGAQAKPMVVTIVDGRIKSMVRQK